MKRVDASALKALTLSRTGIVEHLTYYSYNISAFLIRSNIFLTSFIDERNIIVINWIKKSCTMFEIDF